MRKITRPDDKVDFVFETCISFIKNNTLKENLTNCIPQILEAETEFDKSFLAFEIYKIKKNDLIGGVVTREEMEKVYTDRMVKKDSPGRIFYNKWLASAPQGKCPLCGQRIVSTIDHYLPKSKYPIFAVTPINLIPCCKDCNIIKLHSIPTKSEEQTLHPYYDNIELETWLKARILHTTPCAFEFFVDSPDKWGNLMRERIQFHFKEFELQKLYSSHAAEESSNINSSLNKMYDNGGSISVKEFLEDAYESRKLSNRNSWQTAIYEAMSKDIWFYSGGFKF